MTGKDSSRKFLCLRLLIILILPAVISIDACRDARQDGARFKDLLARGKSAFYKADSSFFEEAKYSAAYDSAINLLEEAISLQPENPEAHYFLGYAYWRQFAGLSPADNIPATTLDHVLKTSEQFELALRHSPNYSGEYVRMGPRGKIMGEWSNLAMAYALRGREDSARWAMTEARKRGGFSDAMLEFGRNLLLSCDSNAVFIAAIDLDTYPLWYLQLMEGLRRDVLVVNYGLTCCSWFRGHLKHPAPFSSKGMIVDTAETIGSFPAKEQKKYLDVTVPIAANPAFGVSEIVEAGQRDYRKVDVPTNAMLSIKLFEDASGATGMIPPYQLFFNWLRDNAWRRPVLVSPFVREEDILGLTPNLRRVGLACALVPFVERDSLKRVDLPSCLFRLGMLKPDPLIATYSFAALKDSMTWRDPDLERFVFPSYVEMFVQVIRTLAFMRGGGFGKEVATEVQRSMRLNLPKQAIERNPEGRRMAAEVPVR